MNMVYSVTKCVINALRSSRTRIGTTLTESLNRASNTIMSVLAESAESPLVAIHGPPGTGKTTAYVYSISRHLNEENVSLSEYSKNILYVTSINRLVQDVFGRIMEEFFRLGIIDVNDRNSLIEGLSSIKVLGSQIMPYTTREELIELSQELGDRVSIEELNKMLVSMTKREEKRKTRIVFTTEWQSVPISLERGTFILVDEASKSPMFHAFTPIARELLRNRVINVYNLHGLTVIGDVQQAISLEPEYSSLRGRELLLLRYVEKYISLACRFGIIRNCEEYILMLKETLRIPKESEVPISHGYYNGLLASKQLLSDKVGSDALTLIAKCLDDAYKNTAEKLSRYLGSIITRVLSDYVESFRAIIDNYRGQKDKLLPPLIVIDTGKRRYEPGKEIEPYRVIIASSIALLLAQVIECVYRYKKYLFTLAVIAPYSELVNAIYQMFLNLESRLPTRDLERWVQFSTVHSFLGGEADFVIAVLGREYYLPQYLSIYFKEPELLNVQLSRHKLLLTVVGSVEYFLHSANQFKIDRDEERVEKTLQQLIDIVEEHKLRISLKTF